jgi:hypothetical protein
MAEERIKSIREQFMKTLAATLAAAETHATRDNKTDAEVTLNYAQAANALMGSELAKQLVVGKDGLSVK